MSALCPVCNLTLPLSLIQSHVNSHFEDDEIENDHHLALQLASSSSSSDHPSSSSASSSSNLDNCNNVASLVHSQTKSQFYSIGHGGLICLLRNCLESELKSKSKPLESSTSLLLGFVDHFQSSKEDKGWGCGWKNIQMQCSHLISHREEAKRVLFGGSNFVPDVPSLQRWLELAWNNGFDVSGALHFNTRIYGSKRWIGTTECAALLRSFGLRARVVDFAPEKSKSMYLSVPGSAVAPKVKSYGPMDRYVVKKGGSGKGKTVDSHGSSSSRISKGAVLMNWVWNYFSDNRLNVSSGVHMTNKGPLYFQHEGHSRTIVGIQRRLLGTTSTPQYNLLILDPADFTKAIEKALIEKRGWERHLKRGAHTLTCPEYQMLYVDSGIAEGAELDKLKTIDSHFVEF
ncbi:PREDICTED: zinc finger with UFM1-specific peptidase domain protein-like [Camelina sativa]|uniref:Zinc finger with UFM1-specific peptidase domain protein-like n=1 Tax=Camelina sativa TaxID=90675 RepID=A0ABM0T5U2_CAMSA|nr:PREDICTED: zinc finger with UFM1-specific peptidase domain protein-like [Camelina sativa]